VAKDQAAKLQILSAKHQDILLAVDKMFEKFATLRQVQEMIRHKYHEEVGLTAIRKYKQKHYNAFKEMVRQQKADIKGIAETIGEDGLSLAVNALLWQELQTMKPTELVAFRKVMNDSEKVAVLKKQFALLAKEHRLKMQERRASLKGGVVDAEVVDPAEDYARAQRVVAQVKEIFGIGMTPFEPHRPPALPAGEEEPPPEGEPAEDEPVKV
jgi:hypothetical protein